MHGKYIWHQGVHVTLHGRAQVAPGVQVALHGEYKFVPPGSTMSNTAVSSGPGCSCMFHLRVASSNIPDYTTERLRLQPPQPATILLNLDLCKARKNCASKNYNNQRASLIFVLLITHIISDDEYLFYEYGELRGNNLVIFSILALSKSPFLRIA